MGTMQMFYALAHHTQANLPSKISVFVALAPCTKLTHSTFMFMDKGPMFYDGIVQDIEKSGVRALYGPNWTEDLKALCATNNIALCLGLKEACIGFGQTISTQTVFHALQTEMKDNFVEFDPDMKTRAQLKESMKRTPKVPLSQIKGVPIHMFVGKDDTVCSPQDARWTFNQLSGLNNSQKHFTLVNRDHKGFVNSEGSNYFSQVLHVLGRPNYKPRKMLQ